MDASFTQEQQKEILEGFKNLEALVTAVRDEIIECREHRKDNDTPFWRRVICRSIFASIEALTNHLKQNALIHTMGHEEFFSEAGRMALNDREYQVSEQGDVISRSARIRTIPNMLLAFKAFSRLTEVEFTINDTKGWEALKRSIKVRDRITHHKSAKDYLISDEEFDDANTAWDWFSVTFRNVTAPAADAADRALKKSFRK